MYRSVVGPQHTVLRRPIGPFSEALADDLTALMVGRDRDGLVFDGAA